jgi:hypothetical protein
MFSSSRMLPGKSYVMSAVHHALSPLRAPSHLLGILVEEELDQEGDVFAPLAERRQDEAGDVEAVVEVLTEALLGDGRHQVEVRRGDDAHVDLDRLVLADAPDLVLLDRAEQLRLEGQRRLRDLVEEERPAVGLFEETLARGSPRP